MSNTQPMMTFTEDEIVQAFLAAIPQPQPGDAMTIVELRRATGRGDAYVRARVRSLIEAGEWECVNLRRPAINGVMQVVAAYRPKVAR